MIAGEGQTMLNQFRFRRGAAHSHMTVLVFYCVMKRSQISV